MQDCFIRRSMQDCFIWRSMQDFFRLYGQSIWLRVPCRKNLNMYLCVCSCVRLFAPVCLYVFVEEGGDSFCMLFVRFAHLQFISVLNYAWISSCLPLHFFSFVFSVLRHVVTFCLSLPERFCFDNKFGVLETISKFLKYTFSFLGT